MKPEIMSETPLPMAELKAEVEKIKKRDGEPSFRVTKTEEYLNAFVHLKPAEAQELVKKIEALNIPRLKDVHIYKIVDMMPQTLNELNVILQSFTLAVNQESQKKIVALVSEARST